MYVVNLVIMFVWQLMYFKKKINIENEIKLEVCNY